jgi:hypothetical protein
MTNAYPPPRYRLVVQVIARALTAGALSFCALPQVAAAQERPTRFELVPYTAFRFGGEFEQQTGDGGFDLEERDARGLIFDIRTDAANTQWEVLYAHQQTEVETESSLAGGPLLDIDADYLHFGGTYLFDGHSVRPFLALTAGVARFDPVPTELRAENYLSASLGGGVHLRAEKRLGVRLEGRVFASLVDSDSELFCYSGQTGNDTNACALVADGGALIQWEARAGLVFRF